RQSHYYINKKGSLQIEEENPIQLFITPCSYNDLTKYGRMPTCVVFIEYSLNDIKSLMKNIDVGKTGYGFLLSKEGVFLNHPLEKEVKDRETIFEQAELRNGAFKMLGEHDVIDYVDERTGQSAWIFYQTIPTTGWIMGTLVVKNEILSKTTELEHKLIKIGLWFLAALIVFFLALLFRAYEGKRFRFWIVILSATVLLLVSLEFVWSIVQTSPKGNESKIVKSTIIVDKAGLHQLISANTSSKASPNYIIPTGVSIESIKFAENKAIIKGHIWQKYPDDIHEEITRGFILPNVLSPTITEKSRHKENKTEEIKWFFEGPLRQQFDNSKYPFDKREISLLIHHVDKNVYLIPDLEAYHSLKPSILPGIKSDLIIPDWLMKSSFFNYQVHQSEIDVENKVENFSNLYFTISAQRDFLKPFIYSVLPIIVVGIMLFVILLLLGRVGS
ncbi:Cache 3/Cache 2 fusion domain-containing protein, partial [Candidatus Marithioploca araucensis]|nr:Cache 3/Cache 2 fusion domain-containing protein [Candidatus Marithioploca araucensis]